MQRHAIWSDALFDTGGAPCGRDGAARSKEHSYCAGCECSQLGADCVEIGADHIAPWA